jgi:hypothetical protein
VCVWCWNYRDVPQGICLFTPEENKQYHFFWVL